MKLRVICVVFGFLLQVLSLAAQTAASSPASPASTITGSGTADYVPVFTGTTTIGNSKIFQTVGGDVGIGTTTPAAKLDVKGTGDVRDTLTLFPKSTHPTLSVHGTAFEVSSTGLVTFVSSQTFPGTGTVTSVGSGTGLTGGPITKSGTLSIDTTKVPLLAAANKFTNTQSVTGNLVVTGVVAGGGFQIGSNLFAFGSYANSNALLGFAGNTTMTGKFNTAVGDGALYSNSTGYYNTASGDSALYYNSTGYYNTANGYQALAYNTVGQDNTATGYQALYSNTGTT